MTAETVDSLVGQVLDGKYRVERKLGQGGMGAVFLATHLWTTRAVALKVIAPQFMSNTEFVERFKREAMAAGNLRHPNVVDVTDFGFADAGAMRVAYLVMEYLDGRSLAEVLYEKRQLPLAFVVDTIERVCLAVEAAHQRGVIHRDLKPDNIWLEPDGQGGFNVKVLDFGLAKLRDSEVPVMETPAVVASPAPLVLDQDTVDTIIAVSSGPAPVGFGADGVATDASPVVSASSEITRVGSVMGTPLYMSPEQCRGEVLDPRSDVYSIGVLAYQMLAGEPPFKGDTNQLLLQHVGSEPPAFDPNADVPKQVEAVVRRALAKAREDRPASATAFAHALRAHSEGVGVVLRRALALYSEHLPAFLRLSFFGSVPSFVVGALLLSAVVAASRGNTAVFWAIPFVVYLAGFLAFTANRAAAVVAVERLLAAPLSPVRADEVFATLAERAGVVWSSKSVGVWARLYVEVLKLALLIPLRPANILAVAAIVVERKDRRAAIARSQELTARLMHILRGIQVFAGVTAISVGASLYFTTFGIAMALGMDRGPSATGGMVAAAVLMMIAAFWFTPSVAIALALLYFRARQAGSEVSIGTGRLR